MTEVFFSEDMAETLRRFFHVYETNGVVTLELNDHGLWLVHPHDQSKQFLGQAVPNERERLLLDKARKRLS